MSSCRTPFLWLGFGVMAYVTMEGKIDHGQIIPLEPEKLPATGRVLLMLLGAEAHRPDLGRIRSWLGRLKTGVDVAEWQRRIRSEWDER